ncbi:uncharacterized protein [Linepithema humile]|uniref:uncharacterized protein n=1 Tax=Linepithema humile TaxID=83485 RepID=UPI00351F399D
MARLLRECNNFQLKNNNESEALKPYACTPKYCLYCCCNSQCCFVVQRRPPRHLWEAWYFWLGVALVAVFVICSVSSYIVNNYRHNIQGIRFRQNVNGNGRELNQLRTNQDQISVSIISTTGMFSSQKKMLVVGAQPNVTHMTPVVA